MNLEKTFKLGMSLYILFIVFLFSFVFIILKKANNQLEERKQLINKNIIIGKDSCIITDYSFIKDSFILNTGVEVDGTAVVNKNFKMY